MTWERIGDIASTCHNCDWYRDNGDFVTCCHPNLYDESWKLGSCINFKMFEHEPFGGWDLESEGGL